MLYVAKAGLKLLILLTLPLECWDRCEPPYLAVSPFLKAHSKCFILPWVTQLPGLPRFCESQPTLRCSSISNSGSQTQG